MSVTVSNQPITELSWNEVNFVWDSSDPMMDRGWDTLATLHVLIEANEPILIGESYTDLINYRISVVEALSFSDSVGKTVSKNLSEVLGLVESARKQAQLALTESIVTQDGVKKAASKSLKDQIRATDKSSKKATKPVTESFSVQSDRKSQVSKSLEDTMTLGDDVNTVTAFSRVFAENLGVSDKLFKTFSKALFDAFTAKDSRKSISIFNREFFDSVGITDQVTRRVVFKRLFSEMFAMAEFCRKNIEAYRSEDLTFEELRRVNFSKYTVESLKFLDAFYRMVVYNRKLSEGFSLAEAQKYVMSKPVKEAIKVADMLLRNADQVVSDFIIDTGDLDENLFADYLKRQAPVGYRDFRDFVEGEYTYQEGLFKVMAHSQGPERAVLETLNIKVDLPDVRDSGRADIAANASGTRILFNKRFHTPSPEVSLTLRGGTVIVTPRVLSSDSQGFTAVLIDQSGAAVAGNVSWFAEGY